MDALDQEMIARLEVSHVIPILARSRRRHRHSPRIARPGAEHIGVARRRRVEPLCLALAAFRAVSDLIEVSFTHTRIIRRYPMKISSLLLPALVALAPLSAGAAEPLVKFDGGIGAIPVSAGVGTGTMATTVIRNIVRGVQPPAQVWTIADFKAEVEVDGHIRADGQGLVFAGGDTIGTAIAPGGAALNVFATLICENTAPFTERNTNLKGVPLAENGDFTIDAVLSPPPPAPSQCATPVLLIRNTANLNWFAEGIQKFDSGNHE
jgi:hypothetical protein